ncbi:MAG: hypothetical protein FWF71_01540 [Actinomycetia bacterium]|nr:hypothetical protein [Actinomycetes bacterium]
MHVKANIQPVLRLLASALLLLALLPVAGCSQRHSTDVVSVEQDSPAVGSENPLAANGNSVTVTDASFFIECTADSIVYQGKPLELAYNLGNTGPACDIGLLVFIGGVPQPYHSDRDAHTGYLQSFHFEQGTSEQSDSMRVVLSVDPTVGRKGQRLFLNVATVLNPGFRPDPDKAVMFGNNLDCGAGSLTAVEYQLDCKAAKARSYGGAATKAMTPAMLDG